MDFSQPVIQYAKNRMSNISFQIRDILQQPINDKYDVIFCTEVLEHLLDPSLFLKNLLAMMSDRGILILTIPNGRKDNFIGHINFWSPESWSVFLKDNSPNSKIKTFLLTEGANILSIISK